MVESQLYAWRKAFDDVGATARNDRGETKGDELKRLRRENSTLREQRDVLRKSISLFVHDEGR